MRQWRRRCRLAALCAKLMRIPLTPALRVRAPPAATCDIQPQTLFSCATVDTTLTVQTTCSVRRSCSCSWFTASLPDHACCCSMLGSLHPPSFPMAAALTAAAKRSLGPAE